MPESIKLRTNAAPDRRAGSDMKKLFDTLLTDVTALRTSITTLTAKVDVLTAKLNADAGVTDINYATDFAAVCNPAALTTTS